MISTKETEETNLEGEIHAHSSGDLTSVVHFIELEDLSSCFYGQKLKLEMEIAETYPC